MAIDIPEEFEHHQDAIDALYAIHYVRWAVLERVAKQVEEQEGIPLEWFEVLAFLGSSAEEGLKMQDLARYALRSKSGMTRLFDRIEKAGLASRELCATDRRVVLAVLTDRGRALIERITPTVYEVMIEKFASHVSPEDARHVVATLNRVLDANNVERPFERDGRVTTPATT